MEQTGVSRPETKQLREATCPLHRPQQTVEDARFWLTEARPILRSRLFFEGPIDNVCAGITEAHVINFALYSKKPIAFETACAACL